MAPLPPLTQAPAPQAPGDAAIDAAIGAAVPDDARLARAAALCAARGQRLTQTRRAVLGLILASPEPVGAYALLDRLRAQTGQGQAPTIYRALEFLLAQGLIHRIERLNAFVPCHDASADAGHHVHPVQFLICERCGKAWEVDDHAVGHALQAVAARHGFAPRAAVVELSGVCACCAAAPLAGA